MPYLSIFVSKIQAAASWSGAVKDGLSERYQTFAVRIVDKNNPLVYILKRKLNKRTGACITG